MARNMCKYGRICEDYLAINNYYLSWIFSLQSFFKFLFNIRKSECNFKMIELFLQAIDN